MVTRTTILRKAFLEWSCLHASSSLCYPNSIKGLTINCLFSQRIYWFLSHAYWTERKVTLWCWTCTHTHIIRSLWYIVEEKNVFKFCFLFPRSESVYRNLAERQLQVILENMQAIIFDTCQVIVVFVSVIILKELLCGVIWIFIRRYRFYFSSHLSSLLVCFSFWGECWVEGVLGCAIIWGDTTALHPVR